MKLLYEYLKDLLKHTLNIYSLFSFVLIFFIPFLPIEADKQIALTILLAMLAVLVASFLSWKDLYKSNKNTKISVISEFKSLSCGSVNGAGMIKEYSRAFFNIDFVNNTNEVQVIKKITSIKFLQSQSLFKEGVAEAFFKDKDKLIEKNDLPIKVNANDRLMFQMEIHLPVEVEDPLKLPSIFSKLNNFDIELVFNISNQQGVTYDHKINLNIKTNEYVKEITNIWKKNDWSPNLFSVYEQLIDEQ